MLPKLLSEHHIVILPSKSEGFPLAPLEAMACGLVPIVSDVPGPTEYISHMENGLLVPVGDANALTMAIVELLENTTLYDRLRQNAITTMSQYKWSNIAQQRIQLYEEARQSLARDL